MTYRDFRHLKLSRLVLPVVFILGCLYPVWFLAGAIVLGMVMVTATRLQQSN